MELEVAEAGVMVLMSHSEELGLEECVGRFPEVIWCCDTVIVEIGISVADG